MMHSIGRGLLGLLLLTILSTCFVNADDIFVPEDFPTIADAVDAAGPGDTIILNSTQGPYNASVYVGLDLTFQTSSGNNDVHIVWDNTGDEYIFYIDGVNVTFNSLTFNGTGLSDSGDGCLQVVDGSFLNLNGIYIANCPSRALYLDNSNFTIVGSTFAENYVNGDGGAVYCTSDDGSSTGSFSGNTFTGNSAENNGGAIYNDYCTISSSSDIFVNNEANADDEYYGGAIYNDNYLQISASAFTGNNAYEGGAIYNDYYLYAYDGNTFDSNTAEYGGAVYVDVSFYEDHGSNFTANNAQDGGAVYLVETEAAFYSTIFQSNYVYGDASGGALYCTGDGAQIDAFSGCSFTSNTAVFGGAIYNAGCTIYSYGDSFVNNNATIDDYAGGAIYNDGYLQLNATTFTGNSAEVGDGGAIYNYGDLYAYEGTTFDSNTAYSGGAIYLESEEVAFYGTIFRSNSAIEVGGAIYSDYPFQFNASTFTDNSAYQGGAIYADDDLYIYDGTTFDSNTAEEGGAVYVDGSNYEDNGSIFKENTATTGGAVYIYDSDDSSFTDSSFNSNSATTEGGAIYIESSYFTDVGGLFEANSANNGGAFYSVDSTVYFTDSSLFNNTATEYGGGAYFASGDANLTATFQCNTAGIDGDDYFANTTNDATVSCECDFIDCFPTSTTTTTTQPTATTKAITTTSTTTQSLIRTPVRTFATTRTGPTTEEDFSAAAMTLPSLAIFASLLALLL